VAAQQELGLLSDWRVGSDPCDRTGSLPPWPNLNKVDLVKDGGTQAIGGVCLKKKLVFSSSPSAFQASLQTSTVQASNGTIGVQMSLIKKCDVKMHFAARRRKAAHPTQSAAKSIVAGASATDQAEAEADAAAFSNDFLKEHRSLDGAFPAPVIPDPGGYGQVLEIPGTHKS
jgi:hypothetical protein